MWLAFIALVLIAAQAEPSASPAASPIPYLQNVQMPAWITTDPAFQRCAADLYPNTGLSSLSSERDKGVYFDSRIFGCLVHRNSFRVASALGERLDDVYTREPGAPGALGIDEFYYDLALATYRSGDLVAAKRFIHRARHENRAGGDASCAADPMCHTINALYATIDRSGYRKFTRADEKRAAAARSALLSAMSADEREVYEDEGEVAPCHKEVFDASGVRKVTWWYCNAKGRYRKAYTFTNGVLTSTYQP